MPSSLTRAASGSTAATSSPATSSSGDGGIRSRQRRLWVTKARSSSNAVTSFEAYHPVHRSHHPLRTLLDDTLHIIFYHRTRLDAQCQHLLETIDVEARLELGKGDLARGREGGHDD